jgi:hypothetical protein
MELNKLKIGKQNGNAGFHPVMVRMKNISHSSTTLPRRLALKAGKLLTSMFTWQFVTMEGVFHVMLKKPLLKRAS